MLTLSVHQPFAYLLCIGAIRCDLRSWVVGPGVFGRILIHASKLTTDSDLAAMSLPCVKSQIDDTRLLFGAIIGAVELTGCVSIESLWMPDPPFIPNQLEIAALKLSEARDDQNVFTFTNAVLGRRAWYSKAQAGLYESSPLFSYD